MPDNINERRQGQRHFEVARARNTNDEWVVEWIDHDGEGEVEAARFIGRRARERAEEYADWKNKPAWSSRSPECR